MSTKRAANVAFIVGIIALIAFGIFTWWVQRYALQKVAGVDQLATFMYLVMAYGIVILVTALRFRITANLKYVAAIIFLTGIAAVAWYAREYVSPPLGLFFGFIDAYLAGILVVFYILGRYGG
jgi:apolipoprotein N-acyltransferase